MSTRPRKGGGAGTSRVLITGAAGGIGAAAAEELRRRGARVVGLDLEADPERDIIACDITDEDAVPRAVSEAVERLGGLDVVINNAGLGIPQSAGQAPDREALRVIDVNLIGAWRVTAAALPALRASGGRGRVVNVASGLAFLTLPFATAYTISKRGIVAYSDALRLEYGDEIDVTTVYPGYIKTPIHAASEADGFALDGVVPEERLSDAAGTLARAALGRPLRDVATTRRGGVEYAFLRRVPRRAVDRATLSYLRRIVKHGGFGKSQIAGDFLRRLQSR
jgi:NAD(P)-dependent dehydrogenase (short-subunit alcohol dehydrogenase family)